MVRIIGGTRFVLAWCVVGGGANFHNITAVSGMNSGSKGGSGGGRSFELERGIPTLRQRIQILGMNKECKEGEERSTLSRNDGRELSCRGSA